MFICGLNTALFWGPDEFVELGLEADGQGVGDDSFDEVQPCDGCLAGGNFFQGFILLLGSQRVNPGDQQGTK